MYKIHKIKKMGRGIKGFILLIEYPGCNKKVGHYEPYTTGEFLKYPKIWEPVYHKNYLRDLKIESIVN